MPQTNVKHWRRLDNAAKLFPAASSKRDTRVFRFYCELKEDIQQEILQKAVDRTLEKYPIFLSVLRKGLFWHYLEQSNKRPVVREEYKVPCSSLYIRDKRDLLFEVTYYKMYPSHVMKPINGFLPRAISPPHVEGPSAITCPTLTSSPLLTIGR